MFGGGCLPIGDVETRTFRYRYNPNIAALKVHHARENTTPFLQASSKTTLLIPQRAASAVGRFEPLYI